MTSKEELRKALIRELKLKDKKTEDALYDGLFDALGYQEQIGKMYWSEQGIKSFSDELQGLFNKFSNICEQFKSIDLAHRQLLDAAYYSANACDRMMQDIPFSEQEEMGMASGFEVVVHRMQKTILHMQENMQKPGKGGFRQDGRKYIAGIEMLARNFSEALPSKKISANQNSLFYRYVSIWFEHVLEDINATDRDLRRHISNTLKAKGVRLHYIGYKFSF